MKYQKHRIENVTRSELNLLIDEHVMGFKAQRNRCILKSRLIEGLTFEELAEKYDMSVRQVKKIVYDLELVIGQHLRVGD